MMKKYVSPAATAGVVVYRRYFLIIVCAVAAGVAAVLLFGCSPPHKARPSPRSSPAPQSKASSAPSPAAASSSSTYDFSDAAMIGNSHVENLKMQELLPAMDYFDRIGLGVDTAFTKTIDDSGDTVFTAVNKKQYRRVYLLFGENELGWEYKQVFYDDYKKLVDTVKEGQPGARIYLQSIFPVSAEVSGKNEDNKNNARIREYNELIRQLAQDEGAVYLDVASALSDASGNLPPDASPDGEHLTPAYCQIWTDYLKTHE